MNRSLSLALAILIIGTRIYGHEGHGIPGALPPAPHGGVVQEAQHDKDAHAHGGSHKHDEKEHGHEKGEKHEGHDHDHAEHTKGDEPKSAKHEEEEQELFFEAVYKNKELLIYPLVLPSGNNPMFKVLSPQKEFSSVSMKIEFPRAKKTEVVKATLHADAIKVPFDAKKVNRFIIHLNVKQANEEKRASIQLENG